jgi:hypothetical protein
MSDTFDNIINITRHNLNQLLGKDDLEEAVIDKIHDTLLFIDKIIIKTKKEKYEDKEPEWLTYAALDVGLVRKKKKRTPKVTD